MSGGARVLIEQAPGQTRALHLDGDRVVESWHDFRHDQDRTGSVHAVRIDRVFAAQNRATATLADGTPVSVRTTRHDSLTAGGMAVITTRYRKQPDSDPIREGPDASTYGDLYWYADKTVVPKAVNHMEFAVPGYLMAEA